MGNKIVSCGFDFLEPQDPGLYHCASTWLANNPKNNSKYFNLILTSKTINVTTL